MSSTTAPHSRLREMLAYVGNIVDSQRQRLDQMSMLAATVTELQEHYAAVESDNEALKAQLAHANARVQVLEGDLAQEQRTREALMASHTREMERAKAEYDDSVAEISNQVTAQMADVREKAQAVIDQIRASANEAVLQAQDEADSMRSAYEGMIAENDKLNVGIATLMQAVEQSSAAASQEDRMIATMADIIEGRRSIGDQQARSGNVLRVVDAIDAPEGDTPALNRVA